MWSIRSACSRAIRSLLLNPERVILLLLILSTAVLFLAASSCEATGLPRGGAAERGIGEGAQRIGDAVAEVGTSLADSIWLLANAVQLALLAYVHRKKRQWQQAAQQLADHDETKIAGALQRARQRRKHRGSHD